MNEHKCGSTFMGTDNVTDSMVGVYLTRRGSTPLRTHQTMAGNSRQFNNIWRGSPGIMEEVWNQGMYCNCQ